jgi:hypothetical protein
VVLSSIELVSNLYLYKCRNLSRSDKYLIQDVEKRNIVVDFNGPFVVHEQIHDVGHGGGNPTSSLVVKLIETFWAVRVSIAGCGVLNPVSTLQ